jgi:murein L,D-transpeptidase YafK
MQFSTKKSIEDIQKQLNPKYDSVINQYCKNSGFKTHPQQITLIVLKSEKLVELWFKDTTLIKKIKTYPILAASGVQGPKLKEGDRQVPEGIYRIEYLNPNSLFYLSMKINYPNSFDLAQAEAEGRTNLGNDIFLHGKESSVGCVAIGDEAIEELFYISSLIGKENIKVIMSPYDFRIKELLTYSQSPWVNELYQIIKLQMSNYLYKI